MSTPLEIVITKRNALALIKESGWKIRKRGEDFTAKDPAKPLIWYMFRTKNDAIQTVVNHIMRYDTTRPVRVQF